MAGAFRHQRSGQDRDDRQEIAAAIRNTGRRVRRERRVLGRAKPFGVAKTLAIPPRCAVVLGLETVETTRLALDSLGVGSTNFRLVCNSATCR